MRPISEAASRALTIRAYFDNIKERDAEATAGPDVVTKGIIDNKNVGKLSPLLFE